LSRRKGHEVIADRKMRIVKRKYRLVERMEKRLLE
jgi:hypothetical protein